VLALGCWPGARSQSLRWRRTAGVLLSGGQLRRLPQRSDQGTGVHWRLQVQRRPGKRVGHLHFDDPLWRRRGTCVLLGRGRLQLCTRIDRGHRLLWQLLLCRRRARKCLVGHVRAPVPLRRRWPARVLPGRGWRQLRGGPGRNPGVQWGLHVQWWLGQLIRRVYTGCPLRRRRPASVLRWRICGVRRGLGGGPRVLRQLLLRWRGAGQHLVRVVHCRDGLRRHRPACVLHWRSDLSLYVGYGRGARL